MVLAEIWTERRLRKARQEVHQCWSEWNRRREEAEAKGEAFTEPPPPPPNRKADRE